MTKIARNSKINPEQALEIRKLWSLPKGVRPTQTEIAKKFGITQAAVSYIVNKKRWVVDPLAAPAADSAAYSDLKPAVVNQPSLFEKYFTTDSDTTEASEEASE